MPYYVKTSSVAKLATSFFYPGEVYISESIQMGEVFLLIGNVDDNRKLVLTKHGLREVHNNLFYFCSLLNE